MDDCYQLIILLILSIIVLSTSVVILRKEFRESYKEGGIFIGDTDIFGNWSLTSPTGSNESLTIQEPNSVLYNINNNNNNIYDNGRYNLKDSIFLVNRGLKNVSITGANTLTLSSTFQRDNNINSCIDNCNNTFGSCNGDVQTRELACEVYSEGSQEITSCENKYRPDYLNCLSEQRNCCGSCRGILDEDNSGITNKYYKCNYPSSISPGSVYGYWRNNNNNNELITINPDGSVIYISFQRQYDKGNFNNNIISLGNNGNFNVSYDSSSDTLMLSKTFTKSS